MNFDLYFHYPNISRKCIRGFQSEGRNESLLKNHVAMYKKYLQGYFNIGGPMGAFYGELQRLKSRFFKTRLVLINSGTGTTVSNLFLKFLKVSVQFVEDSSIYLAHLIVC
jgi:hypothetical protein